MCGAPREQTITQRTEIDPALQRLLYGGALGAGNFGGGAAPPPPPRPAPPPSSLGVGHGGDFQGQGAGAAPGAFGSPMAAPGIDNAISGGGFSHGGAMAGTGAMYAAGGTVQGGIGSMAGHTPMGRGVPMMDGQFPNLSDPEIAAALAMAQMYPGAMRHGFAGGGYIQGPGTGVSDSIPAMIHQGGRPVQRAALSDGEFVMTERAVRGAGEGDRERGAARMYEMMRMFERGGRV